MVCIHWFHTVSLYKDMYSYMTLYIKTVDIVHNNSIVQQVLFVIDEWRGSRLAGSMAIRGRDDPHIVSRNQTGD